MSNSSAAVQACRRQIIATCHGKPMPALVFGLLRDLDNATKPLKEKVLP